MIRRILPAAICGALYLTTMVIGERLTERHGRLRAWMHGLLQSLIVGLLIGGRR